MARKRKNKQKQKAHENVKQQQQKTQKKKKKQYSICRLFMIVLSIFTQQKFVCLFVCFCFETANQNGALLVRRLPMKSRKCLACDVMYTDAAQAKRAHDVIDLVVISRFIYLYNKISKFLVIQLPQGVHTLSCGADEL